MSSLRIGIVGFDITPRFHPTYGAWGTTPSVTQLDMPLLGRCLALEHDGCQLIWFGLDTTSGPVPLTDQLRDEVGQALELRRDQVIWSVSQTHASGAPPNCEHASSCIAEVSDSEPEFIASERQRFINSCIQTAREAIDKRQPAKLWAGRGYCDSISYNRRLPMPSGGVKFSRHHAEGLQSGKFFDKNIGLIRFDDLDGNPLGAIFSFGAHPATMILGDMISPDYVGTARKYVEDTIGGAPAMFCQGFCGDVNCYHIFGTPDQARRTGTRLGKAAAQAMKALIPARAEPFDYAWKTIEIECQPMPKREKIETQIGAREAFVENLKTDPTLTWFDGVNTPDRLTIPQKVKFVGVQIHYLKTLMEMLNNGQEPASSLPLTIGAIRIGDTAVILTPGENFAETGRLIRERSPFVHTWTCQDTNGLVGYIGTDDEIDRGGYETDSFWKMIHFGELRLPPGKGTTGRIINASVGLLNSLREKQG